MKELIIVLIYWTFLSIDPSGDIRHSWFSLWEVESPPFFAHHCAHPFFQFLAFSLSHVRGSQLASSVSCLGLWFDAAGCDVAGPFSANCCLCADKWRWLMVSGGGCFWPTVFLQSRVSLTVTENPEMVCLTALCSWMSHVNQSNKYKWDCSWNSI